MNWVTGKRLHIILSLKGMSEGDEINCQCGEVHKFVRWDGEFAVIKLTSGSMEQLRPTEIEGWRRPTK